MHSLFQISLRVGLCLLDIPSESLSTENIFPNLPQNLLPTKEMMVLSRREKAHTEKLMGELQGNLGFLECRVYKTSFVTFFVCS
jgi:hypothetical protein